MERGQTTLDFAVGVSIFIFALVFVFAFVPGTLQPFTASAQGEMAGSDRVADLVVKDLLVEPDEPYLLDGACTAAMVDGDRAPGCDFTDEALSSTLGLSPRQSYNVTIRGDGGDGAELLCWDASAESVVEAGNTDCNTAFAAGETPPPTSDSIVTARRVAAIDGRNAVVQVRLW